MTIKAVLSDLGNVVAMYTGYCSYTRVFAGIRSVGQALDGMTDTEIDVLDSELWDIQHRFELGHFAELEYRRAISRKVGLARTMRYETMYRRFYDIFTLNRKVRDLWAELRMEDVIMVAVSNLCHPHFLTMHRIGVFSHVETLDIFDHLLLSYEEGLRKPSKELMIRALDRAGVAAEEAVFIDDRPENLLPADELGIRTYCFNGDFKALCDFLTACGMEIKTEESE